MPQKPLAQASHGDKPLKDMTKEEIEAMALRHFIRTFPENKRATPSHLTRQDEEAMGRDVAEARADPDRWAPNSKTEPDKQWLKRRGIK